MDGQNVRAIARLYSEQSTLVFTDQEHSEGIEIRTDTKQGCMISNYFFNFSRSWYLKP